MLSGIAKMDSFDNVQLKFDQSPCKQPISDDLPDPKSLNSLSHLSDLINSLLVAYHKIDILEHLNNAEEDKTARLQNQLDFLQEFHENMTEQHNSKLAELDTHVKNTSDHREEVES